MARALVLTSDLLFGSNLQGQLAAAGHEVQFAGAEDALRAALLERPEGIVIVDLVDGALARVQTLRELREEGFLGGIPLLGYYSHVEPDVRELALAEGFDQVVPRSRMAREAAQLVSALTGR